VRFAPLQSPLFVWVVVAIATVAGFYAHWQSPMGIFLNTPQDWCHGRTHAFGLTYLSVLGAFAAACALLWVGCFAALGFTRAPPSRAKLQSLSRKALVSLAIFAVAMLAVPLFELALPLQKDPMCIGSRLPSGK
jgi:hypothetical protein